MNYIFNQEQSNDKQFVTNDLFKDFEPAPINWVPKDYKVKKIK